MNRPGKFGGSLENRTRFLRELVAGIRAEAPGLEMGVRLSAIDLIPFRPDPDCSTDTALGPGVPEQWDGLYRDVFGVAAADPTKPDIEPAAAFCDVMHSLGVTLLNVTAGSPYYNPHVTRPALYPPLDGYRPAEEPLAGVLRLLETARALKRRFPHMTVVGSGYTYLQEFLPNVAQAVVGWSWADFVGLGRMVLSYPDLPRDVLQDGTLKKKRLPNLQRLHHGPAQQYHFWLLPAVRTLQKVRRSAAARRSQEGGAACLMPCRVSAWPSSEPAL